MMYANTIWYWTWYGEFSKLIKNPEDNFISSFRKQSFKLELLICAINYQKFVKIV